MWNTLDLKCPTKDLCEYNLLEEPILRELPVFVSMLTTSAEGLTQDNPIWAEIKLLGNVQEKYKRILQCDKCLHILQRVGTCIRKMVLLNLSKIYLDLAEQFLAGLQSQSLVILLPSCQQLEYVLIRTQSAAKLICEALHYSRETFCFLIKRLRMGHMVLNLMRATSVAARLNIVIRDILVQTFDIYKKLYVWRKKFKKGTTEWPNSLDLPEDLEAWLNPEASDLLKPQQVPKDQVAFLTTFFENKKKHVNKTEDMDDSECVVVDETSQSQLDNTAAEGEPTSGKHRRKLKRGLTESKLLKCKTKVVARHKKNKKKMNNFLTQSQSVLLEKIQSADSLKELKVIWNHLDVGSQVLFKEVLTPYKIREIERVFLSAKKKLKKIKQSDTTDNIKKEQETTFIQLIGKKLAKHLGLIEIEAQASLNSTSGSVLPVKELKPVKKLKELRLLYNSLYQMLQSQQQYYECAELEKKFKDRRADIKRLIEEGRKKLSKELIFITSKEFLSRFKN